MNIHAPHAYCLYYTNIGISIFRPVQKKGRGHFGLPWIFLGKLVLTFFWVILPFWLTYSARPTLVSCQSRIFTLRVLNFQRNCCSWDEQRESTLLGIFVHVCLFRSFLLLFISFRVMPPCARWLLIVAVTQERRHTTTSTVLCVTIFLQLIFPAYYTSCQ